jgi:hypothetical protein
MTLRQDVKQTKLYGILGRNTFIYHVAWAVARPTKKTQIAQNGKAKKYYTEDKDNNDYPA